MIDSPAPADRAAWRPADHVIVVTLITWIAGFAYGVLGLVRFATYKASVFDLVIVDQAVRGYARFGAPVAPSVGVSKGMGQDAPQLADHFSPIYALLAPFYWISDGPRTLIVCQAVLFALAIPFLWRFAARRLGPVPAHLVAVAYALSWPVAQAVNFDVHEVMFVPVLSAAMIERFDAGRRPPAYLAAFGLLLVKEDLGLLVMGYGAALLLTGRRRDGAALVAMGGAALVAIRGWLIPLAGGSTDTFWFYGHLGDSVPSAVWHLLTHPLASLQLLVNDEVKVHTLLLAGWPVLFACLLSPLALAAVPMLLERMLAGQPAWWAADYQYNAFIVAVVFCAGVDGFTRLRRRLPNRREVTTAWTVAWATAVCAVALTLLPRFALGQLVHHRFYDPYPRAAAAAAAARAVPDEALVEAANHLGPRLTDRTTVLLWEPASRKAPWLLADVRQQTWPFASADDQRQAVRERLLDGYHVVFERDGFVVLNRSA